MNYIKLLNTLGKLVKEGQIKSINEAIQMVQKMGAQVDGLLKQGIENLFKTTKARNPQAFEGWTPSVIEGGKKPPLSKKEIFKAMEDNKGILEASKKTVKEPLWKELGFTNREEFLATEASMGNPFAKKSLEKLRKEKEGVESLFKKVKDVDLPEGVNWKDTPLPVNPKVENFYDELVENAYKESKKTGRDVKTIIEETIDYKFTGNETGKEILDIIEKKFFKADGGRIGYDVGGLTGQAKNIYDSWISAGHSSQDALDYLSSRGMYDAGGGGLESIVNTQQSIIPQSGGGNEMWDPNTAQTKMFNKDVWTEIAPNKYDWVNTEIEGFMSPTGWKTAQGKNINHAGLYGIRPIFSYLFDRGAPYNPGGKYRPGSIKGAWQERQDRIKLEQAAAEQQRQETARQIAAAAKAFQSTGDYDEFSGAGGNVDPGGPASRMSWSDLTDDEGDKYATGGLATMFTRRR